MINFRKNIFFFLLLFILLSGFIIQTFPIRTGMHYWDETVYLQHSEIIAGVRENTFNEFDLRPPLLPLLLSPVHFTNHPLIYAHILVSFLSTLGILGTYLLASHLYNKRIGILSALLYSLIPYYIYFSHKLLVDSILPTFWVFTFFFFIKGLQRNNLLYIIISAFLFSLSVLLKFTSLSLIFVILAVYIVIRFDVIKLKPIQILRDKYVWFFSFFSFITLLPYFIWNYLRFGSPFHVILYGKKIVVDWGAPTDYSLLLQETPLLLLPLFLLGTFLLLIRVLRRQENKSILLLSLILFIPLFSILSLPHIETRYFLPVLPFLVILSSRGFDSLLSHRLQFIPKLLLLAGSLFILLILFFSLYTFPKYLFLEEDSGLLDVAHWLKNNTSQDSIVYTNHEWPVIAYYSKRKVGLLPVSGQGFEYEIERHLPRDGYVFIAPDLIPEPSFEFLDKDPRFTLVFHTNKSYPELFLFSYVSSSSE